MQPHFHFSEWQQSLKEILNFFKMMLPILCRRLTHMEGHIACIQHGMYPSKTTTHIKGFYLIVVFLVQLHGFQSNGSLPCERGFAHTCTNTLFKEYHSWLKWLLKGFHVVAILSSFHEFLYLFNRTLHSCKSLWKKLDIPFK